MSLSVPELRKTLEAARADFEENRISDLQLFEAGCLYVPDSVATWLRVLSKGRPEFPRLNCDFATAVLRDRIGYGDIVHGSYDGLVHAYLDLGETALADETIADVTADQYGGPEVYLGALVNPWSREAGRLIKLA